MPQSNTDPATYASNEIVQGNDVDGNPVNFMYEELSVILTATARLTPTSAAGTSTHTTTFDIPAYVIKNGKQVSMFVKGASFTITTGSGAAGGIVYDVTGLPSRFLPQMDRNDYVDPTAYAYGCVRAYAFTGSGGDYPWIFNSVNGSSSFAHNGVVSIAPVAANPYANASGFSLGGTQSFTMPSQTLNWMVNGAFNDWVA